MARCHALYNTREYTVPPSRKHPRLQSKIPVSCYLKKQPFTATSRLAARGASLASPERSVAAGVARQQRPVNNGTVGESLWNINRASLGNLFTVQSKGTNRPVTRWPKSCAWLLDFLELAFLSIIPSRSGQAYMFPCDRPAFWRRVVMDDQTEFAGSESCFPGLHSHDFITLEITGTRMTPAADLTSSLQILELHAAIQQWKRYIYIWIHVLI